VFNIAANLRDPKIAQSTAKGYEFGQAMRHREDRHQTYLQTFQRQKKIDGAMVDLHGKDKAKAEAAFGTLQGLAPEKLEELAEAKRSRESHDWARQEHDQALTRGGLENEQLSMDVASQFAPIMIDQLRGVRGRPQEQRAGYVRDNMDQFLASAPESMRGLLKQGIDQALADNVFDDNELREMTDKWRSFMPQEKPSNFQFKTTADGSIKAFDPRNPGAAVDTGEAALDTRANQPQKAPTGYRFTQDGNLEPIPGGPAANKAAEAGRKNAEANAQVADIARVAETLADTIKDPDFKDSVGLIEGTGLADSVRQLNPFGDKAAVATGKRVERIVNRMVAETTQLLKGALSEKELKFIEHTMPQRTDPPEVWQDWLSGEFLPSVNSKLSAMGLETISDPFASQQSASGPVSQGAEQNAALKELRRRGVIQ